MTLPSDWWRFCVTPVFEAWCKLERLRADERYHGHGFPPKPGDKRWQGVGAEAVVHFTLRWLGIPHVWHRRQPRLAWDITVMLPTGRPWRIDVKSRTLLLAATSDQESWAREWQVQDAREDSRVDEFFFCAYQPRLREYLLIGSVPRATLLQARLVQKGERITWRGEPTAQIAEGAMRTLPWSAHDHTPQAFVTRLREALDGTASPKLG